LLKLFLHTKFLVLKKIPFHPNYYENIEKEFPFKIKAFNQYATEVEKFPHPRSIEALDTIAKFRGIESNFKKAEAFKIIRELN